MATQVQWRGGSTAEHSTFTGAAREVTVDTQKKTLVVHDGSTAGGEPLLREDGSNSALALGSAAAPALKFTGDPNTGIYSPGADQIAISTGGTGRLFISDDGKIGIGTATPSAYNILADNLVIAGTAHEGISIISGTSGGGNIWFGDADGEGRGKISYQHLVDALCVDTAGSERLRITSDGKLGLGTSSPLALLDVRGNVYMTGNGTSRQTTAVVNTGGSFESGVESSTGASVFTGSTAYASVIGSQNSTPLQFGTNGVIRATLDTSGRLGVGTTSPSSLLHIESTSASFRLNGTSSAFSDYRIGGTNIGYTGDAGFLFSGSSADFGVRATNSLAFGIGASEKARIDSSGRLLVGTSSARSYGGGRTPLIQVETVTIGPNVANIGVCNNGPNATGPRFTLAKSRGASLSGTTIVNNSDSLGDIEWSGADGTDIESIAAKITCNVDGTPGANDMPGRLVFSTTADGASSPTERMRIRSTGAASILSSATPLNPSTTVAAGTTVALIWGRYSATTVDNGSLSFAVWSNGNVINTNNSYGAISDVKLKENIVDANSQWSDIKALQVRNYNFKEGQTHTQIGLVAQEVELVSPGLVSESPDRDEDGNDLGTVTKSVNYSVLYMKAVKALQEAMERIETLEASNTDLLARVSALESA